jgi:Ras-related protein Rab-6A
MNSDNTLDNSAQNNYSQKKFKIVFLGDQGVGKTSIIKRFIYETFDENNAVICNLNFSDIS